ncbi:Asp23/Gls24 family envelope stress response protein [Glaciibacter flavus]|uniref:Asp23/Gls24 family envelope stress response protein n=1 Tax=Orlajensenia flava TaxID=2565934 RepID=A0A4S4FKE7_9MICO|nr:Asp23/Gls24 family envelope stress response protein [Glaciibacter flavus]THG30345.1 Asp23/Gls24 family envelope stress response protein [Glaciibacter flavus]THG30608.1 Asp23/Gls24 family envelope stress response protein [Glaciibacter flavus]
MTEITPTVLDCGKTLDELSDYLAADRTPFDASIETCPECLNALEALERLGQLSRDLLEHEAEQLPPVSEAWIQTIMTSISQEMRAGRSLPLAHPDPQVQLSITEGAIRSLVRATGDSIDGILIGRCILDGDVETPGAPIHLTVSASIAWGNSGPERADLVRTRLYAALRQHTDLNIAGIDITIENIHDIPLRAQEIS